MFENYFCLGVGMGIDQRKLKMSYAREVAQVVAQVVGGGEFLRGVGR